MTIEVDRATGPLPHDQRPNAEGFVLLLATTPDTDADALAAELRSTLRRDRAPWFYVGRRLEQVVLASEDTDGAPVRLRPLSHRVLVTATGESDDHRDRLVDAVLTRAGASIDPVESITVTGRQYIVTEGDEPVVAVFAIHRRSDLTRAEAQQHWRDIHARIGFRFPGNPGSGYRQLHPPQDATGADGPGFYDGITTGHYPDVDFMARGRGVPAYAREAFEDVSRFADYSQCSNIVFHDVTREQRSP